DLDLDADHADLRPRRLDRDRDPGGQPAAADGDHDPAQIRDVLEQLEPERPLAGDDVGIVERVDEAHAGLGRAPARRGDAIGDALAHQAYLRAERRRAL